MSVYLEACPRPSTNQLRSDLPTEDRRDERYYVLRKDCEPAVYAVVDRWSKTTVWETQSSSGAVAKAIALNREEDQTGGPA